MPSLLQRKRLNRPPWQPARKHRHLIQLRERFAIHRISHSLMQRTEVLQPRGECGVVRIALREELDSPG